MGPNRRAYETLGFRVGYYPQGCPNRKFQLAISTYLSNMLQYRKKGGICNVGIGTQKEKVVTLEWPIFSGFYWQVGGRSLVL